MIVKSAARMTGQIMKSFFVWLIDPLRCFTTVSCAAGEERKIIDDLLNEHAETTYGRPERTPSWAKNHTVITCFSLFLWHLFWQLVARLQCQKTANPFFHCRHRFWLCFPHAHSATSSSNLSRNSFFSPVKISDRWEDIRKGLPSLTFFLRFMAKQEINETAPKHQVLITEACKSPVGAAIARNFQQQLIEWNV